MRTNEPSGQETPDCIGLKTTVCPNGVINVKRPQSDSAHSVFVDGDGDGDVIRCSCKGHKFNGYCVHQDEIEKRPLVVSSAVAAAADTGKQVATDGGTVEKSTGDDKTPESGNESCSSDDPEITYHTEPEHVGGERFARCEECGAEVVEDCYGEFALVHDPDCSAAKNVVDPYPDDEEVDRTPL
jgi:hypothetical protein